VGHTNHEWETKRRDGKEKYKKNGAGVTVNGVHSERSTTEDLRSAPKKGKGGKSPKYAELRGEK